MEDVFRELYQRAFGVDPITITPLGAHASKRMMYRLTGPDGRTAVGVANANRAENRAFVGFTHHFRSFNLPVPEIYAVDDNEECYLEEDLGTQTLLDILEQKRGSGVEIPAEVVDLYIKAISLLPKFQIEAGYSLDYRLCHISDRYDRTGMLWDMRFFRDSFLAQFDVPFDAAQLERDFESFADFLSQADAQYFMFRDFQSRNIMVRDDQPYFIDYQAGRRGLLQYDIVSLLYQSKANLTPEVRKVLLNAYLEEASKLIAIDREQFLTIYHGCVYIRLMQVLGTYGEQGITNQKEYFLQSIPYALNNLAHLIDTISLPVELPELHRVFVELTRETSRFGATPAMSAPATSAEQVAQKTVVVSLSSFSYKYEEQPLDGQHGGGFVFDCRCVPNPGREEQYKELTGLDRSVKEFLDAKEESDTFFRSVQSLIDQAIKSYLTRGFNSLAVAFGCTGGQHRSVYFCQRLAAHLRANPQLDVSVKHFGLERMGKLPPNWEKSK